MWMWCKRREPLLHLRPTMETCPSKWARAVRHPPKLTARVTKLNNMARSLARRWAMPVCLIQFRMLAVCTNVLLSNLRCWCYDGFQHCEQYILIWSGFQCNWTCASVHVLLYWLTGGWYLLFFSFSFGNGVGVSFLSLGSGEESSSRVVFQISISRECNYCSWTLRIPEFLQINTTG